MTRNQYKALSRDQRAKIAAELSCYPRLSRQDRLAFLGGITDRTLDGLIVRAKELGFRVGSDIWGKSGANARVDPTPEEFLWRFKNQNARHIVSCFGGSTLALIRRAGVADQMPDELAILLVNVEEIAKPDPDTLPPPPLRCVHPIPNKGHLVRILDTDVTIACESIAEQAAVNRIVEDWHSIYVISKPGWEKIKPIIEYDLSIRRIAAGFTEDQKIDPKIQKEYGELLTQVRNARKELDFPLKASLEDADRLKAWIESAPAYLAERGWRHTEVCGHCNATFQVYYPVCRKPVNFIAHWRRVLADLPAGRITVAETLEMARQIVDEPLRDPFFDPQMTALGTAFVFPLVEWFDQLRDPKLGHLRRVTDPATFTTERYPEGLPASPGDAPWALLLQTIPDEPTADSLCRVQWINTGESDQVLWTTIARDTVTNLAESDIEDGLATFFETGPDHWNKQIPFSIRNRCRRDALGIPQIVEVEE